MEKEELLNKIKNNSLLEHLVNGIELKSNWKQDNGKKISGLANRQSQEKKYLLIGLDDKCYFSHSNDSWIKKTEEEISQHINQFLDPPDAVSSIETLKVTEINSVIMIEIQNPGCVVYWNQKPYKMSGTTANPIELEPDERLELVMKLPGRKDYTAQVVEDCNIDNGLVKEFASVISTKINNTLYKDIDKLDATEILSRLSIENKNAAYILFGQCPARIEYFTDPITIENRETHYGLYNLLKDDFFNSLETWYKKRNNVRYSPCPKAAFHEAIANMIAHAAYFENHGEIIIEVHSDKLVFSNLCLPESIYFANKWFSRNHKSINVLMMEILRMARYTDELGKGKITIFSELIKAGRRPPEVFIERTGRYNRWKLILNTTFGNFYQRKLLSTLIDHYDSDYYRAQIVNALILWREKSISEIKKNFDGESLSNLEKIISDNTAPFSIDGDKIKPKRWVELILNEGKESKKLSINEENELYEKTKEFFLEKSSGYFSAKQLRDFAELGHSKAATAQCSNLLKQWKREGKIKGFQKGVYQMLEKPTLTWLNKVKNYFT